MYYIRALYNNDTILPPHCLFASPALECSQHLFNRFDIRFLLRYTHRLRHFDLWDSLRTAHDYNFIHKMDDGFADAVRCGSDDSRYTMYISHTAFRMYLLVSRTWADGGNGDARVAIELTYNIPRTYHYNQRFSAYRFFCIAGCLCAVLPMFACLCYVLRAWSLAVMNVMCTSRAKWKHMISYTNVTSNLYVLIYKFRFRIPKGLYKCRIWMLYSSYVMILCAFSEHAPHHIYRNRGN